MLEPYFFCVTCLKVLEATAFLVSAIVPFLHNRTMSPHIVGCTDSVSAQAAKTQQGATGDSSWPTRWMKEACVADDVGDEGDMCGPARWMMKETCVANKLDHQGGPFMSYVLCH